MDEKLYVFPLSRSDFLKVWSVPQYRGRSRCGVEEMLLMKNILQITTVGRSFSMVANSIIRLTLVKDLETIVLWLGKRGTVVRYCETRISGSSEVFQLGLGKSCGRDRYSLSGDSGWNDKIYQYRATSKLLNSAPALSLQGLEPWVKHEILCHVSELWGSLSIWSLVCRHL